MNLAGKSSIIFLISLVMATSLWINRQFTFPYPHFNTLVFDLSQEFKNRTSYNLPLGASAGYRDFSGILMGMRRLTADVAWISVLQYYGSHDLSADAEFESHDHEESAQNFRALKKMILRVVKLDPTFYSAYLIGSGALAFNLDRPEEALEILGYGVKQQPLYWKFRLYIGAILYKQQGQFDEMIQLLEDAIGYPDCPAMVKSILANIYTKRGLYAKALSVWIGVMENDRSDPWYKYQAKKNIPLLKEKLKL